MLRVCIVILKLPCGRFGLQVTVYFSVEKSVWQLSNSIVCYGQSFSTLVQPERIYSPWMNFTRNCYACETPIPETRHFLRVNFWDNERTSFGRTPAISLSAVRGWFSARSPCETKDATFRGRLVFYAKDLCSTFSFRDFDIPIVDRKPLYRVVTSFRCLQY